MREFRLILVYNFILFSWLHLTLSLKCRTGNQQSDDQFQKIMQICRKRSLGYDKDNNQDYNGRETDSQESSDSDSEEDLFNNKFFNSGRSQYNKNDRIGSGTRYDYFGSTRNANRQSSNRNRSYWSNNMSNNKSFYDYNVQMNYKRNTRNNGMNGRGFGNNNYSNNRYNNSNMNHNSNYNNRNNNNEDNGDGHEKEQNVDQRGFPERSALIGIMTQNIQDNELRDFVEESIVECYHYLSNENRQKKCEFSQNLLSCLGEKGSERCEDWNDE